MNNTSTSATDDFQWCDTTLDDFHTVYHTIHGFLSLFVCIFGSIANSLNIAVLTRRDMRSPTNAILTGLAIADLIVMLDYIPHIINEFWYPFLHVSRESQRSYGWAIMTISHAFLSVMGHTISIFLTVTLAVWRYIAIAHPQKNRAWCNMKNTITAIITSYVVCPLLCVSLFFVIKIKVYTEKVNTEGERVQWNDSVPLPPDYRTINVYFVGHVDNVVKTWIWPTYIWTFSVVLKVVPSIALTVLSLRLVGALLEAKRRRKQLMGSAKMRPMITNTGTNGQSMQKKPPRFMDKERQTDRTTRMLLAVLLLFLITEIPQGILGVISASSVEFYNRCNLKFGDLMDILALINSAINFILYCTMSRQFRVTFKLLFFPKFLSRWLPVSQDEMNGCEMREGNGHTTTVTQV